MPFAGFLVAEGSMSAAAAIGFATLGSLLGSLLSYALGRFGGRPLVRRFGKALLLDEDDLDRADRFFQRRGAITIFVGRFIPVVRHLISIPAGVGRMRLRPILPLHGPGSGGLERDSHRVRRHSAPELGRHSALREVDRHPRARRAGRGPRPARRSATCGVAADRASEALRRSPRPSLQWRRPPRRRSHLRTRAVFGWSPRKKTQQPSSFLR